MECKHLEDAVDISPTFVKKLMQGNRNMWTCRECASSTSPWMCLNCGVVLCGRYVNGHCKAHNERNENHFVCIDTSLAVFCYLCDDFVINDTDIGTIALIRKALVTQSSQFSEARTRKRSSEINDNNPKKLLKSKSNENIYGTTLTTVPQVGLRNLGNTCFMNAILQSLNSIKDFTCYFNQLPAFEWNGKEGESIRKYYTRRYQPSANSLVEELRKVLCALWQGAEKSISPDALFSVVWKVVPRFRGFQQHDAHEFMLYILNQCHTELLQSNQYCDGMETIVSAMFGGELQSDVTCLKCGTTSMKKEKCLDLSLDIPIKTREKKSFTKTSKTKEKQKNCHLTDCIERFVETEELDESEWYICNKCAKREPSTKKFWLLQLPNVLCLHLKRFRYTSGSRTKVDTFVRFPVKGLDMNPYVLKSISAHKDKYSEKANLYDLAAVVMHHGSGAGSGHYTTYARHSGNWYHFNDSTVSRTTEDAIVHCKGYILFYARQYPEVNVIGRIKCGTRQ